MSPRAQVYLWAAQRASAMVLGLCVLVHLVTLIYAIRGGLSAAEILGRTQGSAGWAVFYAIFVLAVAIHAPIGLRSVCSEWLAWRGASLNWVMLLLAVGILSLGGRAVFAVVA